MKTEPLSNEELERYLSGDMSPAEMHAAELKMSSSDLFSDALEGIQSHPQGLSGFEALQQRFESGLSSTGAATGTTTTGLGSMIGAGFGIALVTVLGLSVANEHLREAPETPEKVVMVVSNDQPEAETSFEDPVTPVDEVDEQAVSETVDRELETIKPLGESEVISFEKTLAYQPETRIDSAVVIDPVVPVDPVAPMPSVGHDQPVPTYDPKKEVVSNVKLVYLHDLKCVDMSQLYEKQIKIRNMNAMSGTRAYSAEKAEENDNPVEVYQSLYIYIDYLDYLGVAMAKFEDNEHKTALKHLKVVLNHYPADVNAHFYGALCYYNLGKPSKAIRYFDMVLRNQINAFDQEAEFYKAMSLKRAGKERQAKELFRKISSEGKFYSDRAEDELRNF